MCWIDCVSARVNKLWNIDSRVRVCFSYVGACVQNAKFANKTLDIRNFISTLNFLKFFYTLKWNAQSKICFLTQNS